MKKIPIIRDALLKGIKRIHATILKEHSDYKRLQTGNLTNRSNLHKDYRRNIKLEEDFLTVAVKVVFSAISKGQRLHLTFLESGSGHNGNVMLCYNCVLRM